MDSFFQEDFYIQWIVLIILFLLHRKSVIYITTPYPMFGRSTPFLIYEEKHAKSIIKSGSYFICARETMF